MTILLLHYFKGGYLGKVVAINYLTTTLLSINQLIINDFIVC